MLISGLQKLTLLDFPGTVSCTVFTAGCNFRCPFCHNASLVLPDRLQGDPNGVDTVLDFLRKRQGLLEGVAVTGGEPLLHADMADFLRKIRELGYRIKLDTKALYARTAGLRALDLSAIERSKNLLLEGRIDYEFRTTVVKGLHTRESLLEAARWIEGAKEYYLQQYKDSGNLIRPEGLGAFSNEEMHALCEAVAEILPTVQLRGVD